MNNRNTVLNQLKIDAKLVGEPTFALEMEAAKWAAAGRLVSCARPMVDILRGGGDGAENDLIATYERAIQEWPVTTNEQP